MSQPTLPTALRPYVVATHGYHAERVPAYDHVALPTPSLVLVIDLADGLRLSGLGHTRRRFACTTAGVCSQPARIHEGGTSHGVMVYLTPLGARALLRMPAAELVNAAADLSEVIGPEATRLRDRMHAAGDWASMTVLHSWLLRRLPPTRHESVALDAWACIMSGAAARVSELADETGWSPRHLHAQLSREVGIAPRTLLSVKRFDESVADVRSGINLADVAARHGYADSAHLSRDWRRFTGFSPTGWRANEHPA